jgi:hypothetical protein
MTNPYVQIGKAQQDKQAEQDEMKRLNNENMIRKQMSTPVSRSFVWHVLTKLGYMQNILETNATVYGKTARQAVANDICREIKKICPSEFMLMEQESEGS